MACRRALRWATYPAISFGVAMVFAVPAAAATVNGTLTIAPELGRAAEQRATEREGSLKQYYWRVPNGAVATVDPAVDAARDLVVVMEPAEGGATAPAGESKVIALRGAGLDPAVVAVTPHTKVRFRNEDPFVYHLVCPQNQAMVGAPPLPPGRGVEFAFDEPGIYEVTDRRMPHIVGYVLVVGSRLVANPAPAERGEGAAFTFADVQPGRYLVKVFHAGQWVAEQAVEVGDQPEVGVTIRLPSDEQQHEGEGAAPAGGAAPPGGGR